MPDYWSNGQILGDGTMQEASSHLHCPVTVMSNQGGNWSTVEQEETRQQIRRKKAAGRRKQEGGRRHAKQGTYSLSIYVYPDQAAVLGSFRMLRLRNFVRPSILKTKKTYIFLKTGSGLTHDRISHASKSYLIQTLTYWLLQQQKQVFHQVEIEDKIRLNLKTTGGILVFRVLVHVWRQEAGESRKEQSMPKHDQYAKLCKSMKR